MKEDKNVVDAIQLLRNEFQLSPTASKEGSIVNALIVILQKLKEIK